MKRKLSLVLIILLLLGNVIFWGCQKEGFHVDEMFSYEQIGNTEYPKPEYNRPGEPCYNTWHSKEYYEDYLIISEDESYDIVGFYQSASKNTAHPPLYLTMLGMFVSLVSTGHFSKWSGISFNIIFYILFLLVVYDLSKRILKHEKLGLLAVVISGINVGIVSTVVFVRVYMMFTFLCVSFLDIHICMIENQQELHEKSSQKIRRLILPFFCLIIGLMTQYYFVIFAFFVCLFYIVYLLSIHEFNELKEYILTMTIGMTIYIIIWPNLFRDLTSGEKGIKAVEAFSSLTDGYINKIHYFSGLIDRFLFGGKSLIAMCLMLILTVIMLAHFYSPRIYTKKGRELSISYNYRNYNKRRINNGKVVVDIEDTLIMFIGILFTSIGYFLIISKIAPQMSFGDIKYMELRYILPVFPLIIIGVLYILSRITYCFCSSSILRTLCCFSLVFFTLISYISPGVLYLYKGASQQLQYLDNHLQVKALYVTDTDYSCSNLNEYFTKHSSVLQVRSNDMKSIFDSFQNLDETELYIYIDNRKDNQDDILNSIKIVLDVKAYTFLFETVGTDRASVYHALLYDED